SSPPVHRRRDGADPAGVDAGATAPVQPACHWSFSRSLSFPPSPPPLRSPSATRSFPVRCQYRLRPRRSPPRRLHLPETTPASPSLGRWPTAAALAPPTAS